MKNRVPKPVSTGSMRIIWNFIHNCSYTFKYLWQKAYYHSLVLKNRWLPSSTENDVPSNKITTVNVKSYLERWGVFKPKTLNWHNDDTFKWDFGTRTKLLNVSAYYNTRQSVFSRIGKTVTAFIRKAKLLHPNKFKEFSWIDHHRYPIHELNWNLLPHNNPIYLFYMVASLLMLKDLDPIIYSDALNYIREIEFQASGRKFRKRLNGPFSNNPIAFEIINQAKEFNRAMTTPYLNGHAHDIIDKVTDTSAKFTDLKKEISRDRQIAYMRYTPKTIEVSWVDLLGGVSFIAVGCLTLFIASHFYE